MWTIHSRHYWAHFEATEGKGIHIIQKLFNKMVFHFKPTKGRQSTTKKSGIYKIPWSCDKAHTGEMRWHMSTSIPNTEISDWRIGKHCTETKYSIHFDRKEGIANIQTYHPTSSGKYWNKKTPLNFNHEDECRLCKVWPHRFPSKPKTQTSSYNNHLT